MTDQSTIDKRFHFLFESQDLIAISTPERIRKHVNKSYCNFFGKNESELVGTCFVDDFPDEKKEFYSEFIKQMSPENPNICTVQKTGEPGNERWIYWTENGIYDNSGQLVEILSVGRDRHEIITTKSQKEDISNLLVAYRDAIDSNIICSITDKRGVINYVNKQFCEVSKYTAEELIGKSHNIINSGYHPKEFFTEMWQTISNGNMWHGEIRNVAKDGSYYWVKTVIIPVKDSSKKITSYLSLRVLITERKQIEEERIKYLSSLEDLIYMVSHELRKPITNCMGILDLMQQSIPKEEELKHMVNYMMESAKELEHYSSKMNDYLQNNKNRNSKTPLTRNK